MEIQERIKHLNDEIESEWVQKRYTYTRNIMKTNPNLSPTEIYEYMFNWLLENGDDKKNEFILQKYREYLIIFKMQKKFKRNRYNPECNYCIKLVNEKYDEFNEYIKNAIIT